MKTLNFEEFELSNESLSKVTGGVIVTTNGVLAPEGDRWCNYDEGNSNTGSIRGFDCCRLTKQGFCHT